MDDDVRLEASERVPGRPFTDPEHGAADLAAIVVMVSALRQLLAGPPVPPTPRPLVLPLPEPHGRQHRVVVCDDRRLAAAREPGLVGFFATKRTGLDASPLMATDDELIQELPDHPGILSYSSLELHHGNWGNLVIVDPPQAKDNWRSSERHARAVRELAPRHYVFVRLHNGVLPGGLQSGLAPVLLRTKYYDFQGPEPWRAERDLGTARHLPRDVSE